MVERMTRNEYVAKAQEWLEWAETGYGHNVPLGNAANMYARPAVAAGIAQVYATLALSAEAD